MFCRYSDIPPDTRNTDANWRRITKHSITSQSLREEGRRWAKVEGSTKEYLIISDLETGKAESGGLERK